MMSGMKQLYKCICGQYCRLEEHEIPTWKADHNKITRCKAEIKPSTDNVV